MSSKELYLYTILCLGLSSSCAAISPKQVTVNQLNCIENFCMDINYPLNSEVAYFSNDIVDQLGSYSSLELHNSDLHHLPLNIFKALNQLEALIVNNCQVQHVASECFEDAEKLTNLQLANNLISHIDENTFAFATQLEQLNLDNNKLQKLPSNAFAALTKLRKLSVQGNGLKTLADSAFHQLKQLRQLNLDYNQLTKLPTGLCADQHQLEEFTARNNRLEEIQANAFTTVKHLIVSNNPQLRTLKLTGEISSFQADNCALQNLEIEQPQQLKQLLLSNTKLRSLNFLKNAKNLRDLDLSGVSQLPALPEPWPAKQLEHMSISLANFSDWPTKMLTQLPKLKYLDVWYDKDHEIYVKDLNSFDQQLNTHHDYMDDNDWLCTQLDYLLAGYKLPEYISIMFNENNKEDKLKEYMIQCPTVEQLEVDELVWNGTALERY